MTTNSNWWPFGSVSRGDDDSSRKGKIEVCVEHVQNGLPIVNETNLQICDKNDSVFYGNARFEKKHMWLLNKFLKRTPYNLPTEIIFHMNVPGEYMMEGHLVFAEAFASDDILYEIQDCNLSVFTPSGRIIRGYVVDACIRLRANQEQVLPRLPDLFRKFGTRQPHIVLGPMNLTYYFPESLKLL